MNKFILLSLLLVLVFFASNAQPVFPPKSYVCYKAPVPLQIDGKMDEEGWQMAAWTDDFVDIEGTIKPAPRFDTRAKMLWDEKYLYVAAELEEPDVWATLTERDAVMYHDNDFEVFIDPDGDTHEYYEMEMNAFNTVWDLFLVKPYRDGGPAINAWDIKGLKTAVQVRGTINTPGDKDEGWTVEIAFPWDVLRECAHRDVPPKANDQWRINFSRVEWKVETKDGLIRKVLDPKTGKPCPEDNWVWSPQGAINMHYPEMWVFVQFSDRIVGNGTNQFVLPTEEKAKWVLRQIYYEEKKYFERHKQYTTDLKELGLTNLTCEDYASPAIQTTSDLYEAMIVSRDGKTIWHIARDGRTWK